MYLRHGASRGLVGVGQRCLRPVHHHDNSYNQHRTAIHARSRQQPVDIEDRQEAQQLPQKSEIIRSSRRSPAVRRSLRGVQSGLKPVPPHQALRDMGIIAVNEEGKPFVDVSCLGRNEPHWFAVGTLENKEGKFLGLLAKTMDEYGYSLDDSLEYIPPVFGDAAAAAAAQQRLDSYDVVAWQPKKSMKVYSPAADKLVDREVHYGRGSGGGYVMLHMKLDPLLVDIIEGTYYYLAWRHYQEVPAVLLYQADLLPSDVEVDEVFKLPLPADPEFIQQLTTWQLTEEVEDEEQQRQEYYGMGGGSPIGVSERVDQDKKNFDVDESGNRIYRSGYAGNFKNPNRWVEGPVLRPGSESSKQRQQQLLEQQQEQQQQQVFAQQKQQQPQQQWQQRDKGFKDRNSQGRDGWFPQQQQQQQRGEWQTPPDSGYPERMRQIDFMSEMGSDRYSDSDDADVLQISESSNWGSGRQQVQQEPATAPADGGRNCEVRQQQMAFMGEMGSERYSDSDENLTLADDLLEGNDLLGGGLHMGWFGETNNKGVSTDGRSSRNNGGSSRTRGRDDSVRLKQMDWMEERGSGRYSSNNTSGSTPQQQQRQPAGGGSGDTSSIRSDILRAFEDSGWGAAAGSSHNPAAAAAAAAAPQQQRWRTPGGPGRASFMEEDTRAWGQVPEQGSAASGRRKSNDSDRSGAAAAQQLHNKWQQEGEYNVWEGLEGSLGDLDLEGFETFDADMAAAASGDPLLQRISELPVGPSLHQQQQQQSATAAGTDVVKRSKSTSSWEARSKSQTFDKQQQSAAAAAPKASRKTKGAASKKSATAAKGKKAAAAADEGSGLGWYGASLDADAEGFEEGWAERIMQDGTDRVGLDDVMMDVDQ